MSCQSPSLSMSRVDPFSHPPSRDTNDSPSPSHSLTLDSYGRTITITQFYTHPPPNVGSYSGMIDLISLSASVMSQSCQSSN